MLIKLKTNKRQGFRHPEEITSNQIYQINVFFNPVI